MLFYIHILVVRISTNTIQPFDCIEIYIQIYVFGIPDFQNTILGEFRKPIPEGIPKTNSRQDFDECISVFAPRREAGIGFWNSPWKLFLGIPGGCPPHHLRACFMKLYWIHVWKSNFWIKKQDTPMDNGRCDSQWWLRLSEWTEYDAVVKWYCQRGDVLSAVVHRLVLHKLVTARFCSKADLSVWLHFVIVSRLF